MYMQYFLLSLLLFLFSSLPAYAQYDNRYLDPWEEERIDRLNAEADRIDSAVQDYYDSSLSYEPPEEDDGTVPPAEPWEYVAFFSFIFFVFVLPIIIQLFKA